MLPDDAARGANLTSYTVLGATAVSDWAVAQMSDYEEIFTNLGSTTNSNGMTYDANVNAYITTGVGGTALDGNYWSATKNNITDLAYCFGSGIGWGLYSKSVSYSVRPVLGFAPAKLLSAATTSDVGKVVCADGHLRGSLPLQHLTSARWCAPMVICATRRLPFPQAAPPSASWAR